MNFSSLSAADKRILTAGAVVAVIALISFLDPSGSWGGIMLLPLLGGLGAAFVAARTQVAPSVNLPAPRGLSLLVLGALSAGGSLIAMLTYIEYISKNLVDPFVILMVVGLIAGLYLLWVGFTAYQAEGGAARATPAAAPPADAGTAPPAAEG